MFLIQISDYSIAGNKIPKTSLHIINDKEKSKIKQTDIKNNERHANIDSGVMKYN